MDRGTELRKRQGARLAAARVAAGYKAGARSAALENGWPESSYRAHESGTRTIGQDDAERYAKRYRSLGVKVTAKSILFDPEGPDEPAVVPKNNNIVPVMGLVGAGAVIEPEFEQIPDDGLYTVELPFQVPAEMIGFEVRGDSMLPRYDDGDVIVVWREQRRSMESFIGEEAAVKTNAGRRYLKNIIQGTRRGTFTLDSFNAKPIIDVRIDWIGEIYVTVRAGQVKRLQRSSARRKGQTRGAGETKELPRK